MLKTLTHHIRKNIIIMARYELKYPVDKFNAVKHWIDRKAGQIIL